MSVGEKGGGGVECGGRYLGGRGLDVLLLCAVYSLAKTRTFGSLVPKNKKRNMCVRRDQTPSTHTTNTDTPKNLEKTKRKKTDCNDKKKEQHTTYNNNNDDDDDDNDKEKEKKRKHKRERDFS